jgi:hypothetical protein
MKEQYKNVLEQAILLGQVLSTYLTSLWISPSATEDKRFLNENYRTVISLLDRMDLNVKLPRPNNLQEIEIFLQSMEAANLTREIQTQLNALYSSKVGSAFLISSMAYMYSLQSAIRKNSHDPALQAIGNDIARISAEEGVDTSIVQEFLRLPENDGIRAKFYNALKETSDNKHLHYIDFDLYIAPDGHAVASSVLEGQATSKISTVTPSTITQLLDLINKRQVNADKLKVFGKALYYWLFPDPIHAHLHQTEAVARRENAKMRIRLRIEAEEIASLPLEFIYRETGGYFIAINPDTVLSRYLNLPLPPERVRRHESPLHMLTIIADPIDQTRLLPDEWESIIEEALADPLGAGQMTLQTVKRATRKEIRNALLKQKPDIIQFVGHGIYQHGKGYLALVDERTSRTWRVDDETFANLYMGHNDRLGLIILATCESAKSDDPQGFFGIAPKLVQRGVPAVISMQYKVFIKTAKIFLEDFYTAIAARKPIDWATQAARNAVSQELGLDNREFATPVLYMRAKDGEIF